MAKVISASSVWTEGGDPSLPPPPGSSQNGILEEPHANSSGRVSRRTCSGHGEEWGWPGSSCLARCPCPVAVKDGASSQQQQWTGLTETQLGRAGRAPVSALGSVLLPCVGELRPDRCTLSFRHPNRHKWQRDGGILVEGLSGTVSRMSLGGSDRETSSFRA